MPSSVGMPWLKEAPIEYSPRYGVTSEPAPASDAPAVVRSKAVDVDWEEIQIPKSIQPSEADVSGTKYYAAPQREEEKMFGAIGALGAIGKGLGVAGRVGGRALGTVGGYAIRGVAASTATGGQPAAAASLAGDGALFETGSGAATRALYGGYSGRRRRRRRRLLTAQDKSDIAFLHGQLGGGALGKAAISAVLSRRVG